MQSYRLPRVFIVFFLTSFLTILIALQNSTIADIIGNPARLLPILQQIEPYLNGKGIDVVGGDTASFTLGERPRVAELSGTNLLKPRDFIMANWMEGFSAGFFGFIAAVATETPATTSRKEFRAKWLNSSADKRVFIAFNAADSEAAEHVRAALEANGYVAFTFLRSAAEGPKNDASFTGTFFREAGTHLVIDTSSARRSPGIWFESLQASRLFPPDFAGGPGTPAAPTDPPKGGAPSAAQTSADVSSALIFGAIAAHWIFTENPVHPGKVFVHRTVENNSLVDLRYLIRVEEDGSWSIYEPAEGLSGYSYGRRLGKMKRPPNVKITSCTCR